MGPPETCTCSQCGQPLSASARFCERCGTPSPTPGPEAVAALQDFHALRVGDVMDGKWRLERKLGSGGMGSVFLAHDLSLDRKVAVKVLAGRLCGDKEFSERFEREARMTAKLEHPNIVPVFAVGRHFGRPFIVMKALDGLTLARMIRNKAAEPRPFSREELLSVFKPLCAGLGFIHAKGYVHRDIKPGNIFISSDGHVTLLDFGVLRDSAARAITRTGALLGTPHYISPEQAKSAREIDARSDLYSLGAMAFECLALRPPFEGDPLTLMRKHLSEPPADLTTLVPGLPPAVAQVVAKALAKQPADRHGSAAELYLALEGAWPATAAPLPAAVVPAAPPVAALAATPGPAPTPSPPAAAPVAASAPEDKFFEPVTPVSLPTRPRWPIFAAIAAVVVAVLVIAAIFAWPRSAPPEPPSTAPVAQTVKAPDKVEPAPKPEEPAKPEPVPTPVAAQPDKAAKEPKPAVPAPTPTPTPAPNPLLSLTPTPAPTPAPPRPRPKAGQLRVVTTQGGEPYWASVSIDGQAKGETPISLDLPTGKHRLHLERAGFKPVDRDLTIVGGAPLVIGIELKP